MPVGGSYTNGTMAIYPEMSAVQVAGNHNEMSCITEHGGARPQLVAA